MVSAISKDSLSDERRWAPVFRMLCLYRQYKSIFPEVILNYNHRAPQPIDTEWEEVLARFSEKPGKAEFTILFDLLKCIDQSINETEVRQFVFEEGILRVGPSYWKPFSLVPGEYPFVNLRSVQLNEAEMNDYVSTDTVLFPKRSLKIATCTLGANLKTIVGGIPNLRGGEYGIYAENIKPPDELISQINSSLDWAGEKKADVVLFPEVSIDQYGLKAVEKWIENSDYVPKLIVAGSFYHLVEGAFRNRATIYLCGRDGEADQPFKKVFYDKRVPCSYTVPRDIGETSDPNWRAIYQAARDHGDKVVVEDFVSGANITLVNTSNGVFGFAICRDVLDLAGVGNPLERYLDFVDFLMIISYAHGGGKLLFEAQGLVFASWHNCAVAYVNASQAIPDLENNDTVEIGYCIYPNDKVSSGFEGEIYYGKAPKSSSGPLKLRTLPPGGNILYTISKTF